MKPSGTSSSRSRPNRTKHPSQPREYDFVNSVYDQGHSTTTSKSKHASSSSNASLRHHHDHHRRQSSHHSSAHTNGGHRSDGERVKKKFRDAIYVGNYERVARIIKNIIENETLDLTSVLLPYASRHVTPIGLAARRGHVKICKVLVEVIKEYVIKQHDRAQSDHDIDMGIVAGLCPNHSLFDSVTLFHSVELHGKCYGVYRVSEPLRVSLSLRVSDCLSLKYETL